MAAGEPAAPDATAGAMSAASTCSHWRRDAPLSPAGGLSETESRPLSVPLPPAIETASDSWAAQACSQLRQFGFARVRLPPEEVRTFQECFEMSIAMFDDRASRRQLRIPDAQYDELDSRSGYCGNRVREWLELHASTPPKFDEELTSAHAMRALRSAAAVAKLCRARCYAVLRALVARSEPSSALRALLEDEQRAQPPPAGALDRERGFSESMLRVYRYNSNYDDGQKPSDGHFDMGLLTIIPKSTSPGLQIQPEYTTHPSTSSSFGVNNCVDIEPQLGPREAIIFGGMTLGRLTGQPALFHRISVRGHSRISSCYFFRPSPFVSLPEAAQHEGESVARFNARARAAYNDELTSTGVINIQPRNREDYERRLAREMRYVRLDSMDCEAPPQPSGGVPSEREAAVVATATRGHDAMSTSASPDASGEARKKPRHGAAVEHAA